MALIVIESNVWIGAAATILPGVTIGHDSVVGAGAVISNDVPPLTVVTGRGQMVRKTCSPHLPGEITNAGYLEPLAHDDAGAPR